MPEIVASFTLTEQELVRIWRRIQLRRWRTWVCPLVGVLLILEGIGGGSSAALGAGWFLMIWSIWSTLSYAPRRLWRKLPTLRERQTITVRETGIEEQFMHVRSTLSWEHWTHVARVGGAWLLRSPGGYTIIPGRALLGSDDDASIERLAGARFCGSHWLPF